MDTKISRARQTPIWLSYDLGKNGDYTNLYRWLKGLNAIECGNSNAFFYYPKARGKKMIPALKREIEEAINITNETRIFIIYKANRGILKTRWIFGNNKVQSPWEKYEPIYI